MNEPIPLEPVRHSYLKTLGTLSPAHLKHALDSGEAAATAAMQRGTAVHAITFATRKVVGYKEGKQRRGEEWEKFQADHPDAEILTATDYARAIAMVKALHSHPMAMRALEGIHERTLLWENEGIRCRSTPDVFTPHRVVELKTGATSKPERFSWHALKMAYHSQLVWNAEAIRRAKDEHGKPYGDPREHLIVAVEGEGHCPVTIFRLDEKAIEAGTRMWRGWFSTLKVCKESNCWPSYTDAVVEITVPDEFELDYGDGPALEVAA